ncbi:SRPBCC family protein [Dyadobacter subterraneus]|uniref:SRPBCC family protein n=1 Tax=Dyadobacter subterraneus TaxID=2773304 RepID=A0ABR9W5X8_9BACT|nr:SRPBCC family protein [Dyadobacter subterraneus]MBE9460862.1 SRPBCC family protein [Dyadobacter subterraneus]
MNVLKIILIGIVLIIGLVLVVALFVKKEYTIEREITINKPNQAVYDYVKYVKNQDNFNVWVMMDKTITKQFRGTDGTVGFVYAWEGKERAGKGEQEIKALHEGKEVDLEIRFEKPFEGISQTQMIAEPVSENQTKMIWKMVGASKYPMNITNLFTGKLLGGDMEKSLVTLKGIIEKQ